MSSPSAINDSGSIAGDSADPGTVDGSLRYWVTDRLRHHVNAVAFWTAIVLPFLHVPMLATGLGSPSEVFTFLVLLVINAVALLIGYPHNQQ